MDGRGRRRTAVGWRWSLPRVASSSSDRVREIHLVARDMTYYVDGQNEPTRRCAVARGERVRVRLINADAGMSHDFSVRGWKKGTGVILNGAAKRRSSSRRRTRPATATYACTPHGEMMRGTIRVE